MIMGELMTEEIYLNNVLNKLIKDVRYARMKTFVVLYKERIGQKP